MKNTTLLVLTFFGSAAMALEPVVLEVKQREYLRPACPVCEGGTMVTETQFKIQDVSCANMDGRYEVAVKQLFIATSDAFPVNVVTISLGAATMDCMGPTYTREYDVTTEAIDKGQPYILTNPTLLKPEQRR